MGERGIIMANAIFASITGKIREAVTGKKSVVVIHEKLFTIEHVNGNEYRITDERNFDCGIRWLNNDGDLKFFLA